MAIPEPPTTFGIWPEVKAISGWPDTDEVRMLDLAATWGQASGVFDAATRVDVGAVRNAWPDVGGGLTASGMEGAVSDAGRVRVSSEQQHRHLVDFASTVEKTKTAINDVVSRGIQQYAKAEMLLVPFTLEDFRVQLVQSLADEVNKIISDAATEVRGLDSGVVTQGLPGGPYAEYDQIQRFIHDEMVRNSNSATVDELQRLNGIGAFPVVGLPSAGEALVDWGLLVQPDGVWDHKSQILEKTAGNNEYTPVPGISGEIRFDVWSNIHYGYVGIEAGFDGSTLHTGANIADLYSPQHQLDEGDQVAVQIGIDLREKYGPGELRPEHLHEAILENYDELVRTGVIVPD